MIWLVAEDEAEIRNLVTTMIHVWGHETIAFENGQKVWDWLDVLENGDQLAAAPDLILMDIRMPGKKGNEIAKRMRTLPQLENTPIALMTAFSLSDHELQEMITTAGVDTVIGKPLPDFDHLRKTLYKLIENKKRE